MLTALAINSIAILFAWLAAHSKKEWLFVSQFLLTIFYGIRYDYGNDYWNYYEVFKKCASGFDPTLIEPGWGIINVACQPIGFMGMVFLLTLFEYYVVYKHIKLYVPRKYWWLAILVFTMTFNFQLLGCSMMRQFLAMVILLYTIKYIANRNILKFLLVLAIAFSIHKTSIVFLPTIILGYYKPNVRNWILISSYVCFVSVLFVVSIRYIEYFQIAATILDDDKYNSYLLGNEGSYSYTVIVDILIMILLMLKCPSNKFTSIVCLISLISYILLPFTFVVVMLLRLMLFFSFFFIFSIPDMFSSINNKIVRYGLMSIFIMLMLKRTITSMSGETYGEYYNTFQTIFSAQSWI